MLSIEAHFLIHQGGKPQTHASHIITLNAKRPMTPSTLSPRWLQLALASGKRQALELGNGSDWMCSVCFIKKAISSCSSIVACPDAGEECLKVTEQIHLTCHQHECIDAARIHRNREIAKNVMGTCSGCRLVFRCANLLLPESNQMKGDVELLAQKAEQLATNHSCPYS
jgi:hypothetical protein